MRQVGGVPPAPPARMTSNVFGETRTLCASCSGPSQNPATPRRGRMRSTTSVVRMPVRVDGDPPAGTDLERASDVGGDCGVTDPRRGARYPGRLCVAAEGTRLLEVDRQELGARRGADAGSGAGDCGVDRREREDSVDVPGLEGLEHAEEAAPARRDSVR